jgi:starvation-inducible outer membrane lipoprotein
MRMNTLHKLLALGITAITLTACQSAPSAYNGQSGYQIENKSANSATLVYTLAGRQNQQLDEKKLQRACQKVMGNNQTFKLTILSVNEIANPASMQNEQFGRQIGNSRTSIGLSNTPDLHNSDNLGAQQALDARPATLRVVRYTCS